MSNVITSPPQPAKCAGYKSCGAQKYYRKRPGLKLYKNTTNLCGSGPGQSPSSDQASLTGSTLNTTTGAADFQTLHSPDGFYDGISLICGFGDCARNVGSSGNRYTGNNFDFATNFCGPWTQRPPVNTFSSMPLDALAAVSVVSGGTGYTDGAVLTVTLPYAPDVTNPDDRAPTFRIHSIAGVIQSATVIDPGAVYVDLTALTAATGGGGSSAVFTFLRQDAVHEVSGCNQVGWAAVCSNRRWHGHNPFNDPNGVPTIQNIGTTEFCLGLSNYEPCRASTSPCSYTVPQTKYLKMEVDCTYISSWVSSGADNFSVGDSRHMTINPNSGIISLTGGSDMPALSPANLLGMPSPTSLLSKGIHGGLKDGLAFLAYGPTYIGIRDPLLIGYLTAGGFTITFNYTGGAANGTGHVNGKVTRDSDGFVIEWFDANFDTGHFEWHFPWAYVPISPDGGPGAGEYLMVDEVLDISATVYSLTQTFAHSYSYTDPPETYEAICTATLSIPNTVAAVTADAEANYQPWLLLDRTVMPLQTRPWDGIIPKVSRNELNTERQFSDVGVVPLTMPDYSTNPAGTMDWYDNTCQYWKHSSGSPWYGAICLPGSEAAEFTSDTGTLVTVVDGSILGQPLALINGDGVPMDYFDANFLDYENCPPRNWTDSAYLRAYGKWNKDYRVTQTTNRWEASQLAFCRQRLYGPQFAPLGGIWVSKCVQTVVRFPAFNHARPFGKDRWLVDENKVGCFTADFGTSSFTGIAGTFARTPTGFAAGQNWAMFETGVDGLYHIDTFTNPSFTCHSVGSLPSGFDYWDDGADLAGDTKGICFQFRMPSCPPFGGRLAVVSVADNGDGTCTVVLAEALPVLNNIKPDGTAGTYALDFCAADMTALKSNVVVGLQIKDSNGNRPGTHAADAGQLPLISPVDYIPTASTLTTFIVTAALADISATKWVVLYGALPGESAVNWQMPDASNHPIPKWYWCYDGWQGAHGGVGTMVKGEWSFDLRTTGEFLRMSPGTGWLANTAYAVNTFTFDGAGNMWEVTASTPPGLSGSGSSPFTGSPTVGGTVTDGNLTWTCQWVTGCTGLFAAPLPDCSGTFCYGYDPTLTTLVDVCKKTAACGPGYIVLSPHSTDTPPAGQGDRFDFSDNDFVADPRYGSRRVVSVFQGMTDPFYQIPHPVCAADECGTESYPVKGCPPTCVPIVEARAILPGSSSLTTSPDGGGGAALNETPTLLIDYTMLNAATHNTGNIAFPPSPTDQPATIYAPTGTFTPCP